jgi:hypothetical protein
VHDLFLMKSHEGNAFVREVPEAEVVSAAVGWCVACVACVACVRACVACVA